MNRTFLSVVVMERLCHFWNADLFMESWIQQRQGNDHFPVYQHNVKKETFEWYVAQFVFSY